MIDEITLAFDTLTAAAAELGYSIHGVPRDGNCLFSAIAYQLESVGIQNIDAQSLRKTVVNYIRDNHLLMVCSEFVPEPANVTHCCHS